MPASANAWSSRTRRSPHRSLPPPARRCPPLLGDGATPHRGKSRTTAALLALLLGGLGVHRFYLGTWGLGLVYLILTLVLPGAGYLPALVEAIRFFAMSPERFDDQYNLRSLKPFTV